MGFGHCISNEDQSRNQSRSDLGACIQKNRLAVIKDECISLLLELSGTLRTAVAGCWAGKWGSPHFSVGQHSLCPGLGSVLHASRQRKGLYGRRDQSN